MSLKEDVDKALEEHDSDSEDFFDALEEEEIYATDLEDLTDFGKEFVPEKLPEKDFEDIVTVELYIPEGSNDLYYRFVV